MHLAYNFVISKGKLCKLKKKETEEIRKFCVIPIFLLPYFSCFTILLLLFL